MVGTYSIVFFVLIVRLHSILTISRFKMVTFIVHQTLQR